MLRVGGEVIPEMLEIDALAAMHQRQRRLAVEMEMPQVAQQPDLGPVADAGPEGIHQHDLCRLLRKLRRTRIGEHHADVMAATNRQSGSTSWRATVCRDG